MALFDFLFGKGDKMQKVEQFTPEQKQFMGLLSNALMGGKGGQAGGFNQAFGLLQQYLNPESDLYQNFEAPYLQQFQDQTIPMLAERFAGAGGPSGGGLSGALSSSAFAQSLGSAGSQLQTNLAQMKSGLQRESIADILGLSKNFMGMQPFGYQKMQGNAGLIPQALGGFAQGFGGGYGVGLGRSLFG